MFSFDLRNKMNKEPIHLAAGYDCPAITLCCDAWYKAVQSAWDRGLSKASVWLRANEAYRNAMPPLNSPENIRDFVACLAHGMIINVFTDNSGSRLLKAATLAETIAKDMSAAGTRRAEKAVSVGEKPIRAGKLVKKVARSKSCATNIRRVRMRRRAVGQPHARRAKIGQRRSMIPA